MSASADPYKYFRVEAKEIHDRLSQGVLAIEREGLSEAKTEEFLRDAHTLKGAARIVKLPKIAELAHQLEDLMGSYRNRTKEEISVRFINNLLSLIDQVRIHLESIRAVPKEGDLGFSRQAQGSEGLDTVRIDLEEVDGVVQKISETASQMAVARGKIAEIEAGLCQENASSPPRGQLLRDLRKLASVLEKAAQEFHEMQDAAQRLRLVSIKSIIPNLERTMRDAAADLQRDVLFEVSGSEVRLDSHVLEVVQRALFHVIRNAVDHGIEKSEDRLKSGKPKAGHVSLSAKHQGHRIVFICTDDGRGIDVERVRQKAIQSGFISQSEADSLSAEEVIPFILRSGLSTASQVTQLSGRGVGLDVASTAIKKIGGDLVLETRPGHGTTVKMSVPVSLSSLYSLEVIAGGQSVSLPLAAVRGALRVPQGEIVESTSQRLVVYQGKAIPYCSLHQILGIARKEAGQRTHINAIMVEDPDIEGSLTALGIDQAKGARELVVRPLPTLMPQIPEYAGVSLDSEGNPRPVLDVAKVVLFARQDHLIPDQSKKETRSLPILVVDDSLTSRMLQQRILEQAGFEVDLAESAEEALGKAAVRDYGIFLVDVEMPGMNGFEFVSTIRQDPKLKEIPAMLVTSLGTEEHKRRGMQVGAQGYIVKSELDETRLISMIRSLTGRL